MEFTNQTDIEEEVEGSMYETTRGGNEIEEEEETTYPPQLTLEDPRNSLATTRIIDKEVNSSRGSDKIFMRKNPFIENKPAESRVEEEVKEEKKAEAPASSSLASLFSKRAKMIHRGDEHPTSKRRGGTGEKIIEGNEAERLGGDSDDPSASKMDFIDQEHSKNPFVRSKEEEEEQERRIQEFSVALANKRKVVRKRDIADSIKRAAEEELLPPSAEENSVSALSTLLKTKAKELGQFRIKNPEIASNPLYGKGIKFLRLPNEYNLNTIQKVWDLAKKQGNSSLHNVYLNIMVYVFKYMSSIDKDFTKALFSIINKDDDLKLFARYLLAQNSVPFHVSELPKLKYNGDSRFNLLRLHELKVEFAKLLAVHLEDFCQVRQYSCRIHYNTRAGGVTLLSSSSGISPSSSQQQDSQQEDDGDYLQTLNFGDDLIPKTNNARKLRDTTFEHKFEEAREARELFYCDPRSSRWWAQELQKTDETPYFPADKEPCLYFPPLRMMLEGGEYEFEGIKYLIPAWGKLYLRGIVNVAGEHTLDGKDAPEAKTYQGAFDLFENGLEKYLDQTKEDPLTKKSIILEPNPNTFFLQDMTLGWRAVTASEEIKDIFPETAFRFINRHKKRTEFLCKVDSKRNSQPIASGSKVPFPVIHSHARINVDLMMGNTEAASKFIEQGMSDNGFVMIEPILQVKGSGRKLCSQMIEWILDMKYSGWEGPTEIIKLLEFTKYCEGMSRNSLIAEVKRLKQQGLLNEKGLPKM